MQDAVFTEKQPLTPTQVVKLLQGRSHLTPVRGSCFPDLDTRGQALIRRTLTPQGAGEITNIIAVFYFFSIFLRIISRGQNFVKAD